MATGTQQKDKLVQLIIFNLSGEEFAIPIQEVREIIRSAPVTPVPGFPDFIKGLINVRGEIAVVIDLRHRFGLGPGSTGGLKHLVITAQEGGLFAFMVDEVTEVLRIAAGEVKSSPEVAVKLDEKFVTGLVMRGKRLIVVLDLAKVLSQPALAELAQVRARAAREIAARGRS